MARPFKALVAGGIVGALAWALREYGNARARDGRAQITPVEMPAVEPDTRGNAFRDVLVDNLFGALGGLISDPPKPGQPVAKASPVKVVPTPGTDLGPQSVDFGFYERKYGLPAGYLRRTAQVESAMNPRAKNPRSSASGLFQFITSTARSYGLVNPFDAKASTDAAARLARDNNRTLRKVLGRDATGGELYLAHQQGGGGAAKLLRNRNARAVDVVGAQAVRLNGGTDAMTAGQFADLWINKWNGGR